MKRDWWEVAISLAVVLVWLGVARLADRPPAPAAAPGATLPAAPTADAAAAAAPRT